MAQYIPHDRPHPEAGKWGRSRWKWHRLEWLLDGDGGACDGASACDTYLSPPYFDEAPDLYDWQECRRCANLPRPRAEGETQ